MLPSVLLCAAFLVAAVSYPSLPPELPVMRNWAGHATQVAATTPLVAFRTPLMGALATLVAGVMRSRALHVPEREPREAWSGMFSALMLTAAAKAACEALELGAHAAPVALGAAGGRTLWLATLGVTIGGLGLAIVRGWSLLRAAPPTGWRLARRDSLLVAGLLVAYAAVAIVPLLGSRSIAAP